jgi:hypothetical protein
MYNPFAGDKEERQPEYMVLEFDLFTAPDNFPLMKQFVNDRISNLHQYPLKVNIFDFPMISKKEEDDTGTVIQYSYVDGETVRVLSERLNFTIIYFDSPDGEFLIIFLKIFCNLFPLKKINGRAIRLSNGGRQLYGQSRHARERSGRLAGQSAAYFELQHYQVTVLAANHHDASVVHHSATSHNEEDHYLDIQSIR